MYALLSKLSGSGAATPDMLDESKTIFKGPDSEKTQTVKYAAGTNIWAFYVL